MEQEYSRYTVSGLSGSALAYVVASVFRGEVSGVELAPEIRERFASCRTLLLVVPDRTVGEALINDIYFFIGANPVARQSVGSFLGWEVLPFDALSPTRENSSSRLTTLYRLQKAERTLVLATPDALMQRIISPEQFSSLVKRISVGEEYEREDILRVLDRGGYSRSTLVEERGDMAVRGSVIDFFSPVHQLPIRVEFFDNQIESIRSFDPQTQRSVERFESLDIVPVGEMPFLGDDEDVALSAITKLKARASQLDIPLKELEGIEEAIRSNQSWPGLEHLQGVFNEQTSLFWDYLGKDALCCLVDSFGVAQAATRFQDIVQEQAQKAYKEGRVFPEVDCAYMSAEVLEAELVARTQVCFEMLRLTGGASETDEQTLVSKQTEISDLSEFISKLSIARETGQLLKPLSDEVRRLWDSGVTVGIITSQKQRTRRIADMLTGCGLPVYDYDGDFPAWRERIAKRRGEKREVFLLQGIIGSGFCDQKSKFCLIYESDIFPELIPRRKTSAVKNVRRFIGSLSQLKEGDYIVHVDHGVALYHGLVQVLVEGKLGDFLHLEYAEGAKLYLPVENIAKVQKYVGVEGRKPVLTKLGTNAWAKTTSKVQQQVAELAGQLISLYAQREIVDGYSFGEIDATDLEFADSFGFEETPDQAKAIEEVLTDMGQPKPMDRLVCGDVGYGKTEVGIRAAYKAVSKGRQVAVLVPTTVLADQHFATFKERFSGFPVNIGCVSRFFTPQENKETLAKLARGALDIIIGTHRILQKDVSFKNIGLVIIDEEHKFGVAHKEKLKQFRREVDVLTLTATPIPRTLHMSLVGIRDLSVIETPPVDRQVIQTYLAPYEPSTVREAILRELGRGGQVFFINNRVQNIDMIAREVKELVPEARVEYAHGQMHEQQLNKVMHRFHQKEIDVLVCTTIVESGLDIPNANTIIIRKAENFGLAELYQLRGRVGRSSRRAYAYLLIANMNTLGPEAKKRLHVLQSLDDLGVGFRLALQDMEIRGAGNLLGKDQSGQVNMVGFELYSRILKDAVMELRHRRGEAIGDESRPIIEPEMKIGFPAHIPPDYIPDVAERLLLYQRLVELENRSQGFEVLEEIADRFGHLPKEVEMLVELMIFRSLLRKAEIVSASFKGDRLSISFHPEARLNRQKLVGKVISSKGQFQLSPAGALSMRLSDVQVDSPIVLYNYLDKFLSELN